MDHDVQQLKLAFTKLVLKKIRTGIDPPILRRSFCLYLLISRQSFSLNTTISRQSFSLNTPQKTVHGWLKWSPPPQEQEEEEEEEEEHLAVFDLAASTP